MSAFARRLKAAEDYARSIDERDDMVVSPDGKPPPVQTSSEWSGPTSTVESIQRAARMLFAGGPITGHVFASERDIEALTGWPRRGLARHIGQGEGFDSGPVSRTRRMAALRGHARVGREDMAIRDNVTSAQETQRRANAPFCCERCYHARLKVLRKAFADDAVVERNERARRVDG